MLSFNYTIKDPVGIHARPAGKLVKLASTFKSTITVSNNDKRADARKLFALITLGVKTNAVVHVTADGTDEIEAIKEIETFFKENL